MTSPHYFKVFVIGLVVLWAWTFLMPRSCTINRYNNKIMQQPAAQLEEITPNPMQKELQRAMAQLQGTNP